MGIEEKPNKRRKAQTREGKSPVGGLRYFQVRIQSTAKHEEFRRKEGGPPPKAKYYLITDRGEVP